MAETYERAALKEFLADAFARPAGSMNFRTGELSKASMRQLRLAQERLAKEFDRMCKADATLAKSETTAIGLVVASRPFLFTVFDRYRRS